MNTGATDNTLIRAPLGNLSFKSSASHSTKYRPDIDGLRAIAVLAVLFFHAGFTAFVGGFVGVDVFYVISGYLITSLLVKDMEQRRFSLASFYERRLRRIFPALFAVLFFCIFAACLILDPNEMRTFGATLLSTTFFVSNFYFWRTAHPLGYFDKTVDSNPLLHTWSLSVEEQFYVFFPLILFLLFRWARTRVRLWLMLLAASSFVLNLWATEHKSVLAFYWFMPRAWELLAGALVAVKIAPALRNRALRELLGVCGLGAIVLALFLPITHWAFPGYIVLLPCMGTALAIYAGESGPSLARSLLSFRPLVFIGTISYSLYLWHWPVIVFSKHLPFHFTDRANLFVVLIFSFLLAFLSFEFIERPFRGERSAFNRQQIFALGAAASFVAAAFGALACLSQGLPMRYDAQTRPVVAGNLERMTDFDESCSNWMNPVHRLADIKFCVQGDQYPHKVLFWGDSHVQQLQPAIDQLYRGGSLPDHGVVLAINNGCLPDQHLNNTGYGFYCDSFSRFAMLRAKQPDIDTVFIGFGEWWTIRYNKYLCAVSEGTCRTLPTYDAAASAFVADLSEEIHELRSEGKRVIVSLPFPWYDQPIPDVEISNAVFGKIGFAVAPSEISSPLLRQALQAAATKAGAEVFDPREALCHGQQCLFQVDGISIYKDDNHLAPAGALLLTGSLQQILQGKTQSDP
jgi:peptidoglycan/LPS O-acetylase OafA/YrhL